MDNVWCENAHCSAYGLIICSMARRSLNVALPTLQLYTCQLTVLARLSLQPFGALWYTAGTMHSQRKSLIRACRSSGEEGAVEVKSFHLRLYLTSGLWHFIQEPTVRLPLHAFLSYVMLTGSPAFEAGQYEACRRMGCGKGEALVVLIIGTSFYLGSVLSYF